MNNEVAVSRGVYPCIYSPVGCACPIGSNQLNQGMRCIRRGGGGSFRKRRAKTLRGCRLALGWAGRPHLAAARPPVASGAFSILVESSHNVSHGG